MSLSWGSPSSGSVSRPGLPPLPTMVAKTGPSWRENIFDDSIPAYLQYKIEELSRPIDSNGDSFSNKLLTSARSKRK